MQRCFTLSGNLRKPANKVSLARSRVKLECSKDWSNLPVDWQFSSSGNSSFSDIYTVGQITYILSSSYKVDTDNKTPYDVVIDSVDSSHKCTIFNDVANDPPSYFAELIVLGKIIFVVKLGLSTACFCKAFYSKTASAMLEVCKDSHKNSVSDENNCTTKTDRLSGGQRLRMTDAKGDERTPWRNLSGACYNELAQQRPSSTESYTHPPLKSRFIDCVKKLLPTPRKTPYPMDQKQMRLVFNVFPSSI